MNSVRILLFVHYLVGISGFAQSFEFPLLKAKEKCDVRVDWGQISCLYRVSLNDVQPTLFRKVFLDENLRPTDSLDYEISGVARLVASESNEKYIIHVFYSKTKKSESFHFIVTEKSGKVHSTFTKSAPDFDGIFPGSVSKINKIGLSFIENIGSPEMLILRPNIMIGGEVHDGRIVAYDVEDGHPIWILPNPFMSRVLTTENELIGLTSDGDGSFYYSTQDTLHFFDKHSGGLIHSAVLDAGKGYRLIAVLASNGKELMIAGSEYPPREDRNGHFYMSMFDLSGNKIFDRVDTAARLSTKRMHTLGHAFDRDGNVFIIGESWKYDYTAAIVTTAASIILIAATRGSGQVIYAEPNHKITSLVMAKISPEDGTVQDFYSFAVGPWMQFSQLTNQGKHTLITNANRVLSYDQDQPNQAPANFTALQNREGLIIAPFGPIIITEGRKRIGLEVLHSDH